MGSEESEDEIPPDVLEKAQRLPPFAFRGTGAGGLIATIKSLRAQLDQCQKENVALKAALARSQSGASTSEMA